MSEIQRNPVTSAKPGFSCVLQATENLSILHHRGFSSISRQKRCLYRNIADISPAILKLPTPGVKLTYSFVKKNKDLKKRLE